MPCFQPQDEQFLANYVEQELISSINGGFDELQNRRVFSAPYPDPDTLSDIARASSNCIVLQQTLLHRTERLTHSLAPVILDHNVYGLALLIRGHYESTALLGYFCYRLDSLMNGFISFDDFQFDLAHTMVSSKHDHFKKAPDPQNILKCIERTDKFLSKRLDFETSNMVADNHGWLSEFCHPNFLSLSAAVRVDKQNSSMIFRHDDEIHDGEASLLGYVDISTKLFLGLFDAFTEMRSRLFPEQTSTAPE